MTRTTTTQTGSRRKPHKPALVPQEDLCAKYSFTFKPGYWTIKHPENIVEHFQDVVQLRQEATAIYYLGTNNEVLGRDLIALGQPFPNFLTPFEIVRSATRRNAKMIVLVHIDIASKLIPTPVDMEVTRFIYEEARRLHITLVDHLIVTDSGFFSFFNEGFLYLDKEKKPQTVNIELATDRTQ